MKKVSTEFKVGKNGIGYLWGNFEEKFKGQTFKEVAVPPRAITLPRDMTDAQIESELKPGYCTLGDVLAVLKSDDPKYKDGYANLFYFKDTVVSVDWYAGHGGWVVGAWGRDGIRWYAGHRVFSLVTDQNSDTSKTGSGALEPSETLPETLIINGIKYKRV